jgi:hypothetical protein
MEMKEELKDLRDLKESQQSSEFLTVSIFWDLIILFKIILNSAFIFYRE